MELDGQAVSVVGLGASGEAAALLALSKGGKVYVSDVRSDPAIAATAGELRGHGAQVDLGDHDLARISASDTVVVSPGIPPEAAVLRELGSRGVRWISEAEFAFQFLHGPLIAVTGTNGKTTTAALTAHLLQGGGCRVGLGGNIGGEFGPAMSALALQEPSPDWFVVEMSSFQLADTRTFNPDIGVLTNLAPDHLDRYESVEAYYRDKAKLFQNATPESRWVLPAGDSQVEALVGDTPGERFYFTIEENDSAAAYVRDDMLTLRLAAAEPLLPRERLALLGRHNVANALAAALAAGLAGVTADRMASSLSDFPPLPHRLEPVTERDGVLWVNDSKATNVAAACSAIASFDHLSLDRPLVVLLGGKDKGEAFEPLARALQDRARVVIAMGAARHRILEALSGLGGPEVVDGSASFDRAVIQAVGRCRPGDILLLSPACSSFDSFESYQARGERFRELAGRASV